MGEDTCDNTAQENDVTGGQDRVEAAKGFRNLVIREQRKLFFTSHVYSHLVPQLF